MRVTARSRFRLTLENLLFTLLWVAAAGLIAFLSTRYHLTLDWTASGRNSLSEASRTLLQRMPGPVSITAFARDDEMLRGVIADLVSRYQRHKGDLDLKFVNPDAAPGRVRELGIQVDGELVLDYQGRSQHVTWNTEQALTNGLQKVARRSEGWLAFLEGHGERAVHGQANHDLGLWARQLEGQGLRSRGLNLAENAEIPENTSAVVIAGPAVKLLPGEVEIIRDWVRKGGNLLWLMDPGEVHGLQPLLDDLGLETVAGVIVDPATRLFGIDQPDMAIVSSYPPHPATRDFELLTVFPQAMGLKIREDSAFETTALLTTQAHAWAENGVLEGEIQPDDGNDTLGPLTIAYAMTRVPAQGQTAAQSGSVDDREQRLVVIGDGDFLANSYLGSAGNLDLGVSLANWLAEDDELLVVPARTAKDQKLALSVADEIIIGAGHLLVIPGLLLGSGLLIWLRRRKR